jgi:hypothetical protein
MGGRFRQVFSRTYFWGAAFQGAERGIFGLRWGEAAWGGRRQPQLKGESAGGWRKAERFV